MSEEYSTTREDFPKWAVTQKFLLQEGACPKCSNPLEKGYHRHHKNGDHADNSVDNLELLCPECHHAEKAGHGSEGDDTTNMLIQHRLVERSVMKKIVEMIELGMEKKIAGAGMERLMDANVKLLQLSRSEKGLNNVEYPPAEIKMILSKNIAEEKMVEYIRGVEAGIKMIVLNANTPIVVNNSG